MESRWRRFGADVVSRAIPLDLIDAIKRNVEAIAALVLDDGDFDRALAEKDFLHTAIDPDTVLEVDDVIAGLERGETLQRTARRVPSRASETPLAAEDFVVGEDTVPGEIVARRNDNPAIEDADCQARR